MKKIVIIGPAYPYRGGQALVESHLYHKLSTLGYECHTISFTLLYPKLFFPGTSQFDHSKNIFFNHTHRVYRIINSINPVTWFKAAKKIKALNPDNIIFVWWMPFFGPAYTTITYLVKKWTKSKVTFLIENYISHENRWFDKFWSKVTLKHTDYFICQSDFVKHLIASQHKQHIFKTTLSVYECFDFKNYSKASAKKWLGIPSDSNVITFFGLIRKYKGLDKLIQAYPLIRKKYPNTTLLIVGECYEDVTYYEKLIKETEAADNIVLINKFIANEDIEPYFKASDMVCLPYNSASQSGILMMAYGFKIPVVVNKVGGLPEFVIEGKTGTVMNDNKPETIAESVGKVYQIIENGNVESDIKNLNKNLGYLNLNQMMQKIISDT